MEFYDTINNMYYCTNRDEGDCHDQCMFDFMDYYDMRYLQMKMQSTLIYDLIQQYVDNVYAITKIELKIKLDIRAEHL